MTPGTLCGCPSCLLPANGGGMEADKAIEALIAGMTADEKVGQLVMAVLPGTELDEEHAARLRAGHFAGVVLFSLNIKSIEQTLALTAAIHACRTVDGLPPLIGVDQECGRVRRLM